MWAMIAAVTAFVVTSALGRWAIPFLHRLKYGQTILEIGPSWHKKKQGTPTMGGIIFIAGIVLSVLACIPAYYMVSASMGIQAWETPVMITKIYAGLGMAVFYGLVGFLDDYIKVVKKQNLGLNARQKLIFQFIIVSVYLWILYVIDSREGVNSITSVNIPFYGPLELGILYFPIMAVIIVGIVNAVNLTDGIDGLCASATFFVAIFYMVMCSLLNMFGLSMASAALAGGCLGFLIWNFYPAKIFMGDTGSLFLGGMICALGMGIGLEVIMIIMAAVYILEMFSVILQVLYFKLTKGKRLFKMSPIHHHFEMCGLSETAICILFSACTIILGIICSVLVMYVY